MSAHSLRYDEAVELIAPKLADLAVVFVGGQALNYWVDRYRSRVPELEAEWPFTSEDIDFFGDGRAADILGQRLGGRVQKPAPLDPSPNSGLLHVPLPSREKEVRIDVLRMVHGVDDLEVQQTALTAVARDGSALRFKVMHPVLCMFSRAANVTDLPGYNTEHAVKQLRGSVFCAREFLRELVARDRVRDARKLTERVFRFSLRGPGLTVFHTKAVDLFAAAEPCAEFGEKFLSLRYPQMTRLLATKREKTAELAAIRNRGKTSPG